jgi:tetratricopeptide (TPR) repeat protein
MPVEQALGEWDAVDERADVFALGSILCEILTGQPAYRGTKGDEVSRQAKRGDLTEALARLEQCRADAALVALGRECLSSQREARPRNADVMAKRVDRYQAEVQERLRKAELERVQAEGERLAAELRAAEERKRRRVQRALALAVGLLAAAGLAFGWWQTEQGRAARQRQASNAEAVAGLLNQCERALRAGDAATAATMLEAAQKRATDDGVTNEAERLARCQDDLAVLFDLDAVDRLRWTPIGSRLPALEAVAERYREALSHFRADPDAVGGKAAAARMAGSTVRERLMAALDRLLWARKSAAIRAALQSLDPDSFRDAVRDAVCGNDGPALARLVGQTEALAQPPGFAAFLGDRGVIDDPERRRALLRTALQRRPGDLGLLMGLGGSYPLNHWEGAEERVRWFQAAVTAAPANPATYNSLGHALHDKGDLDGAIAAYQEAIRLDPKYPWGHNNLGWTLHNKGDLDGAIAAYQEAIRLDSTLALPHDNLGEALQSKGDLAGALAAHNEALRLNAKFAWPHNNLGLIRYYKKDLDGAIAAFQQSIQLDDKYAKSRNNLGLALEAKGNLEGAIAAYREAVRIDSRTATFRDNLSRAQRLRELLPRLPNVRAGTDKPKSPAEACDFALLCARAHPKHYADSVRFFVDAFAADPQLAEDRKASHRYNAACFAALAGCGKGADAPHEDKEKARLRGQALTWLRADLMVLHHEASFGEAVQRYDAAAQLSHWLIDSDFAGVRPGPDQAEMPTEERAAWDKLWADVRATLAVAQKAPTATSDK